jgi:predicted permease
MELLRLFGHNLLPIFLAAGTGWVLAARMGVSVRPLSQVGFFVFSPCLVFQLIVENRVPPADFLRIGAFAAVTLGLTAAVALLIAHRMGLSRSMKAAVLLCVLLPNAGNYGMSASLFAFGEAALAQAGLFFVTMAVLSYTVGVFAASMGKASVGQALRSLWKVPTIWAVPLAFLLSGTGARLPVPVGRTVELFADATIPTFLLILGMQLRHASPRHNPRALTLVAVFRLGGAVVAGILLAPLFGLEGPARQAGLLEAGMPAAVINTILATEYDVEPGFVATAVFVTTVLSPLTLTPLLAWLGA